MLSCTRCRICNGLPVYACICERTRVFVRRVFSSLWKAAEMKEPCVVSKKKSFSSFEFMIGVCIADDRIWFILAIFHRCSEPFLLHFSSFLFPMKERNAEGKKSKKHESNIWKNVSAYVRGTYDWDRTGEFTEI
ncbi:hypothetical protein Tcan_04828 [Toxocara canis]|uniref:Uncharacterized protein n=1 Tax=Toxocara canis TaxID=6265 RepID=A0A0B2VEP6_TOXCA|nr:hypothetical protein Tcan_04828 [Toxocara canis]